MFSFGTVIMLWDNYTAGYCPLEVLRRHYEMAVVCSAILRYFDNNTMISNVTVLEGYSGPTDLSIATATSFAGVMKSISIPTHT